MSNYRYIPKDRHLQQTRILENLIHNYLDRHMDHLRTPLHLHQYLCKCGIIVVLPHLHRGIIESTISIGIEITDIFNMSNLFQEYF